MSGIRSWTIEVCRTCDRLAQWPFCEHRPSVWTSAGPGRWTETVVVTTRQVKRPAAPSPGDGEPDT